MMLVVMMLEDVRSNGVGKKNAGDNDAGADDVGKKDAGANDVGRKDARGNDAGRGVILKKVLVMVVVSCQKPSGVGKKMERSG